MCAVCLYGLSPPDIANMLFKSSRLSLEALISFVITLSWQKDYLPTAILPIICPTLPWCIMWKSM